MFRTLTPEERQRGREASKKTAIERKQKHLEACQQSVDALLKDAGG